MEVDGKAKATIGHPPDRDIAFQISGINSIKAYLNVSADAAAADIAVELTKLFDEYHAVTRTIIVDIKGRTRQTADSVIVYMSSTYHKQKATSALRKFLKEANQRGFGRGVTEKYCFDLGQSSQRVCRIPARGEADRRIQDC
jgi:hypothetical protein